MEEKNKSKGKKGITLVSLVITIIVILILAGVAINLAMDEEGLIGKAEEAVESWNRAVGEESNAIKNIFMIANEIEGGVTGGEVEEVPIPNGYRASEISTEDSVAEGLVIYEIPEGAEVNWTDNEDSNGKNQSTITIEGNTTNLQETVNQYVWIPVEEINDMVMCENNNKLADENENKICNIVYNEEANTLTCQTHSDTATNLVGRLYTGTSSSTTDEAGNEIFSFTINFEQTDQTYYENSGNREPAIVTGNTYGTGNEFDVDSSNLEKAGMAEGSTAQDFLEQMQSDFIVMAKSVAKNGGFYISRYEVGAGGSSKKGQQVLTAGDAGGSTYLGANTWYGLYNTIRNINENKQMIWGCQYDQVIKFLIEQGEEAQIGHTYVSDARALSGQNEQDCMRNIYDLEGNTREWTAEANSDRAREDRGSCYYPRRNGIFSPASDHRGSSPSIIFNEISSRTTLYL